ncbi:SDR family NAD(P)-dependent oxidoreductase [Cupriavidus sp. 2SB]|uniref:SDR family NAD(P)-dependent oxidoreductase n=1 Tax=Cupriavidus sp. 2SB TaxID=2502199 RepID=UPI0010F71953|nr:SDR family NAD(P)-dependent oxidoreductase [Cupriavidus sp. 2SB]
MNLQLHGKKALVTGATNGIGEAIAKFLATEGVHVVVHGRDSLRAAVVVNSIRAAGGVAVSVLGDLANDQGAQEVASSALAGGVVDILVNNADFYHHFDWTSATPEEWVAAYETNVVSAVRMVQHLVPVMRERGWGRVIQVGGGLASQPIAPMPQYKATLAARHNLAVSLARELKGSGVTSNVVAPGAILVPSVREFLKKLAQTNGWGSTWKEIEDGCVRDLVPNDVGRLGRPEEVAAAVAYLASPLADYVSGATLRVDGGTVRSAF